MSKQVRRPPKHSQVAPSPTFPWAALLATLQFSSKTCTAKVCHDPRYHSQHQGHMFVSPVERSLGAWDLTFTKWMMGCNMIRVSQAKPASYGCVASRADHGNIASCFHKLDSGRQAKQSRRMGAMPALAL
ncbi:hypothetical protein ABBQ38_003711 [Trebouxia sp. C0009 RCD-2024]